MTTEVATAPPRRRSRPFRSWELAAYRAGREHAGHGCPNDSQWPAAVQQRAAAYATNLRATLASAAQQRADRIAQDWGTKFGAVGEANQDRWERGSHPSAGFRIGFIDTAAREWPYDAQRAHDDLPHAWWAPPDTATRQAGAVLRRLSRSGVHTPRLSEEGGPEPQPLPEPRDLNSAALARHIVDAMTSEQRHRQLQEFVNRDLHGGHDLLPLLDYGAEGPGNTNRREPAGEATTDAADQDLAQRLAAILSERLPDDPYQARAFVRAAAAQEGTGPLAWLAGHLGWPGDPACCTASCRTCGNE